MINDADDLYAARESLGFSIFELARALRLDGGRKKGGDRIREMERGARPISGPISVAVEALLTGFRPAGFEIERRD